MTPEPAALLDQLRDRVHVWVADAPEAPDPAWIAEHEPLLCDEELSRYRRFIRRRDRDAFLLAHALVRLTLSRYCELPPAAWRFQRGPHGRPEIANEDAPVGLRCNLSHTEGMVALVVHRQHDCGVDIERVGRVAGRASVARDVFAVVEQEELRALPPDQQEARFYRLWTLKEAFLKAKGTGLALPLQDFWFTGFEHGGVTLGCLPTIDAEPGSWRFTTSQPSPHHVLSTACRADPTRPPLDVELLRVALT